MHCTLSCCRDSYHLFCMVHSVSREANGQLLNISMGQGQEKIALNALNKMAKEGGWIMLQNIHLMQAWLKDLERALEVIEEFVHDAPQRH